MAPSPPSPWSRVRMSWPTTSSSRRTRGASVSAVAAVAVVDDGVAMGRNEAGEPAPRENQLPSDPVARMTR